MHAHAPSMAAHPVVAPHKQAVSRPAGAVGRRPFPCVPLCPALQRRGHPTNGARHVRVSAQVGNPGARMRSHYSGGRRHSARLFPQRELVRSALQVKATPTPETWTPRPTRLTDSFSAARSFLRPRVTASQTLRLCTAPGRLLRPRPPPSQLPSVATTRECWQASARPRLSAPSDPPCSPRSGCLRLRTRA